MEIKQRIEDNQAHEQSLRDQRAAQAAAAKVRRADLIAQKQQEIANTVARRQVMFWTQIPKYVSYLVAR